MKDDRRQGPPNVQLWSREGFGGPLSVLIRPTNGTEYVSVQGPHAPRRAVLERMTPADQTDPEALPSVVATSRHPAACFRAHSAYALRRQKCGRR
jgi:homogentisate 1,2-dioxygenase